MARRSKWERKDVCGSDLDCWICYCDHLKIVHDGYGGCLWGSGTDKQDAVKFISIKWIIETSVYPLSSFLVAGRCWSIYTCVKNRFDVMNIILFISTLICFAYVIHTSLDAFPLLNKPFSSDTLFCLFGEKYNMLNSILWLLECIAILEHWDFDFKKLGQNGGKSTSGNLYSVPVQWTPSSFE